MYHGPEKPRAPDHYAALGVTRDATAAAVKTAFHKLALKHHPDKQACGGLSDAAEFCRVREAYEILVDVEKRKTYDSQHSEIQEQWQKYHRNHAAWQRRADEAKAGAERAESRAAAAEAEAEAERAKQTKEVERRGWIWTMGRNEDARRGFQQHEETMHRMWGCRYYCGICKQRLDRLKYEHRAGVSFPRPAEYAEYLQMKVEQAEQATQAEQAAQAERAAQAAHRSNKNWRKRNNKQRRRAKENQRAEQEKAARVRKAQDDKRSAKIRAKEQRSNEAARRARVQQEKNAHIRIAKHHVKDQKEKYLAVNDRVTDVCMIDIGWTKVKGPSPCLFCEEIIMAFLFRCFNGGATACVSCKTDLCRLTPAKEAFEGGHDEDGSQCITASKDAPKEGNAKTEQAQRTWKPTDARFRGDDKAGDSDGTEMEDGASDEEMCI